MEEKSDAVVMEDCTPEPVVNGSADGGSIVYDDSESQSSLLFSDTEKTIVVPSENDESQKDTSEQLSSQIGSRKRSLSENEDDQNPCKKKKIDHDSIIEKQLLKAIVKLDRSPVVEQLLVEYKGRQNCKNVVNMWAGWKAPDPNLTSTLKHLKRLISETEQLLRGASASRKWRIKEEESASLPKFLEVNEKISLQTETVSLVNTGPKRGKEVDKCQTGEPIKESGEPRSQESGEPRSQESGGLCGFDLDVLTGNFRGFPNPSTRTRDELKKKIKELERNASLVSMLEETDQAFINPWFEAEKNDTKPRNKQTLIKGMETNDVTMRINQHLKDLKTYVADNVSTEPPYSYMVLAIMALTSSAEASMPLGNILQYIRDEFPYYRTANSSWVMSVHQTIHWSDIFVKTCPTSCHAKRASDHGGCWTVDSVTAEAILERAGERQLTRARGALRFNKNSTSPLLTNKKYNHARKKTPVEPLRPVKTDNNNIFEDITKGLNLSVIKKKKRKAKELNSKDELDEIHHILKDAENCEIENMAALSATESEHDKFKENMDKNRNVDDKIKQHLEDLVGIVADNPSTEPPFSYMVLAIMALKSSPQPRLPLDDIFQFIREKFPYYYSKSDSWTNSAKRTICWSSNVFVKACLRSCHSRKSQDHEGCWSVDPVTAEEILARAVEVHRRKDKGNLSKEVDNDHDFEDEVNSAEEAEHSKVSTDEFYEDKENISRQVDNDLHFVDEVNSAEEAEHREVSTEEYYEDKENISRQGDNDHNLVDEVNRAGEVEHSEVSTEEFYEDEKNISKQVDNDHDFEDEVNSAAEAEHSEVSMGGFNEVSSSQQSTEKDPSSGTSNSGKSNDFQNINEDFIKLVNEVSMEIEKFCKIDSTQLSKNEDLSGRTSHFSITKDFHRTNENFIDLVSPDESEDETVSSNAQEDLLQVKGRTFGSNSHDELNDTNICRQSSSWIPNESENPSNHLTFYCQYCNTVFVCVFYMKHHRCPEGGSYPGYGCFLCHTKFTFEDEFRFHLLTDHRGQMNKHEPSPLCWTFKNCESSNIPNLCECLSCPAAFPNQELLGAHIKFVHC